MNYINHYKIKKIRLKRDLTKHIKRGHPWIFSDAIEQSPENKKRENNEVEMGLLLDKKKQIIAQGIYCRKTHLSFRVLKMGNQKIDNNDIEKRLLNAIQTKKHLLTSKNQCMRVINGEGDLLPGIIADYYQEIIVIKLDGETCQQFWNRNKIADFFATQKEIPVRCVYYKKKNQQKDKGEILYQKTDDCQKLKAHLFLENNVTFQTNIVDGAKTGFFLDQRDNREFIRKISKDKKVLNLFGYTGGFSVYAGMGKASHVTTVDIAPFAIEEAKQNWKLNGLDSRIHDAVCEDAFRFIDRALIKKEKWDLVICDPPSFAPNEKSKGAAFSAYTKLFSRAIQLTHHEGLFVASSCSGHINENEFLTILENSLSRAKSKAMVKVTKDLPEDHCYPLSLPELRYLKFVVVQVFFDSAK